jgi:toxin-antitoxin system PIN domain toxin
VAQVIAIDANLLIYAYVESLPQHARAKQWLIETFSSATPVYLPWSSIHAFLRLTTKPTLFHEPYGSEEAIAIVDSWLARRNVSVLEPGARYWTILRDLIRVHDVRGDLMTDAHLAALAIEHEATVYSADKDFARFTGLRVINPLV